MVADPAGTCNLTYVSFQQMVPLAQSCAGCVCKADQDMTCTAGCSALNLYNTQIQALKANNWWDRYTRAIVLDLSVFFPNFNLFQAFRLFFEFPATGMMYPTAVVRTFKLYPYASPADQIVLGFQVLFLVMVAYYSLDRILLLRRVGWRAYVTDVWVYIDWANFGLFYALIATEVNMVIQLNASSFSTSSFAKYVDMSVVSFLSFQANNLLATNFVLVYLKFMKYLVYVPRVGTVLITLALAMFDLVLFSGIAALFIFAFGGAFYLCVGKNFAYFSSIGLACSSLTRMLLGFDPGYNNLYTSNNVMTPFLYYAYEACMFFIMLNMFLSILNETYGAIKEQETADDFMFYVQLRKAVTDHLSRLFKRKARIQDLEESLEGADKDGDQLVSMEELEEVLKNNPGALEILKTVGVKELMAKYDVQGDGTLNRDELKVLLKDLFEKEAEIDSKIKGAEGKLGGDGKGEEKKEKKATVASIEGLLASQTRDGSELRDRLTKVEGQIKDMSRSVAKKLSLMIDLGKPRGRALSYVFAV